MRSFLLASLILILLAPLAEARGPVPARSRQAFQALRAGDMERALRESERATREEPRSSMAWSVRAYVLSHDNQYGDAEAAYRQAIRLDPGDAVVRNNLGTVLLKQGRLQNALRAFNAALSINPRYADASNNRGAALERLGNVPAAQRAYRRATVMNPRHARAHNNLGAALLKTGDVQGAGASFAKAASLDPGFDAPALNLALLDEGSGGGEALLRRLEAAAARPGAPDALKARVHAVRGGMAADERDWTTARREYLAALRYTPRDTALLNNVAVVEDQLGLDREALLHLTEALDIDPTLRIAQNNIGIVHVHRGQLDTAKDVFDALIADDPNFHRAHYNLGVIYAANGDVDRARVSFRRASRLAPEDAAVRYNLAILDRSNGGDLRSELRAYEEVLRLDPNLVEVHLALGMLLADPATPERMRNPARARQLLERFLEMAPAGDAEGRGQAEDWLAFLES